VDTSSKFLEPLSAATYAVHERAPQRRASSPRTFLTFLPTAVRPDAPTLVDAVSRADFHRRLVSCLAIPCAAHLRLVRSHASSSGPRRTPKKHSNHSRRHVHRGCSAARFYVPPIIPASSASPTTRTGLISPWRFPSPTTTATCHRRRCNQCDAHETHDPQPKTRRCPSP
jgi:hypothetical protein